jgi:AMP nucleosidase
MGAQLRVAASRPRIRLDDPKVFRNTDESEWDLKQKKLFLFHAERMELSCERVAHYTATPAEAFQRYVIFTNYAMHIRSFLDRFPDASGPTRDGAQMPAHHAMRPDGAGISIVNIGVGPSNAKTITDHVAVLRPDAMLMIGHCGGLRNHQDIGDYVLARSFVRADGVLDDVLPRHIPITSNHHLNVMLLRALERRSLTFRLGTVYTTANRNWELNQRQPLVDIEQSRALAVDMESATVATNGYRYRIPTATLLCVSDKPLHATPKAEASAQRFYQQSKEVHLDIALDALDQVRAGFPDGIPGSDLRSHDEPLMGGGAGPD